MTCVVMCELMKIIMSNGFGIAGVLFCLSGLIWVIGGNIPIGMMNVCVGLMFTSLNT